MMKHKTTKRMRIGLIALCVLVGGGSHRALMAQSTNGPFDGRWSATIGPQGACNFTSTLIIDVVGSSIAGNATNPFGVFPLSGTVNPSGAGVFKIGSFVGTIKFSGTTFEVNYANTCGGRIAAAQPAAAAGVPAAPPTSNPTRSLLTGNPALTTQSEFNARQAQQELSQYNQQQGQTGQWPKTGNVTHIHIVGHQETSYAKMVRLFGKDEVERAFVLFPWASQGDERTQYLIDEMRAAADRQQGHSYSIHVK